MFSLLTQMTLLSRLNRWMGAAAPAADGESGIANALMESSQARGLSPYQAEELRLAARAYLSVVR
jgi:hypothetical protein